MNQDDMYQTPRNLNEKPTRARPLGITFLASMNILAGIITILYNVIFNQGLSELATSTGTPAFILMFSYIFSAILNFLAGGALWQGKKWGWWVATLIYLLNIYLIGRALITLPALVENFSISSQELDATVFGYIARLVGYFFIIVYFFDNKVIKHFGFEKFSKKRTAGFLLSILLGLAGISAIISQLN